MRELKIHALVYQAADMLGIEGLKTFSAANFLQVLKSDFQCLLRDGSEEDLKDALSTMYDGTRADDQTLRLLTTLFLVQNHSLVENHESLLDIITYHEAVLWKACVGLTVEKENCIKEKDEAWEKVSDAQVDAIIESEQAAKNATTATEDRIMEKLKTLSLGGTFKWTAVGQNREINFEKHSTGSFFGTPAFATTPAQGGLFGQRPPQSTNFGNISRTQAF